MPATMGENCHNDRGGDREMKGSEKTSIEGGDGERDVVWKEGQAKIKRAQERKMKGDRKPEKERGRVAVSRLCFTRCLPGAMNF